MLLPALVAVYFLFQNPTGTFIMLLDNGVGGKNLVISAVVLLNGKEVFGTKDFNQKVFNLTKDVAPQEAA